MEVKHGAFPKLKDAALFSRRRADTGAGRHGARSRRAGRNGRLYRHGAEGQCPRAARYRRGHTRRRAQGLRSDAHIVR